MAWCSVMGFPTIFMGCLIKYLAKGQRILLKNSRGQCWGGPELWEIEGFSLSQLKCCHKLGFIVKFKAKLIMLSLLFRGITITQHTPSSFRVQKYDLKTSKRCSFNTLACKAMEFTWTQQPYISVDKRPLICTSSRQLQINSKACMSGHEHGWLGHRLGWRIQGRYAVD